MKKFPIIILSIVAMSILGIEGTYGIGLFKSKKKTQLSSLKVDYKNPEVAGKALALLFNEYSVMGDTIAKELSAKFRKSAAMQTEIARAYFRNNDRENTRLYLDKAMAIDHNYSPAYNLKGRSYGTYDKEKKMFVLVPADADSACYWFDKAIAADKTNPQPYLDYADAMSWKNMPAALAKLEELRHNAPNYNVDLAIAELYETKVKRSSTAEEAAAARIAADSVVARLDPNKLGSNQLAKFAMAAFWASNTKKAEELALIGTKKFPNNKDYNRVVGWSAARNGDYERALDYLDIFYSKVPKDSVSKLDLRSMDFLSYGIADLNLQRYSQAEADFRNALATNDDYTPQMPMQINSAWNGKFRGLLSEKKYEEAYNLYPRYIATLDDSEKSDKWVYMYNEYAAKIGESSATVADKKELLTFLQKMADHIGTTYPDLARLPQIYYYDMVYTQEILDPESTEGTAVPIAYRLLEAISGKTPDELQSNVRTYASTACDIIAFYEFKGSNNTATAIKYWQKALYYNPDDTQASNILTQLHASKTATVTKTATNKKRSKRR